MKIGGIDVKQTIDDAQLFLEQDTGISKSTKAIFTVILTLLHLMLEKLYGDKIDKFGKTSEKSESLDANNKDTEQQPSDDSEKTVEVASYSRKKKVSSKRKLDISNLPSITIYHDLPEDEKQCNSCNSCLQVIDKEITNKLQIIPSLFYVEKHVRYKYTCKDCQTLTMAPKPLEVLPKAPVGNSVIAEVATNKFQYHLPLYRQTKIFSSLGIDFADNTLSNWIMQSGEQLLDIFAPLLWKDINSAKYLQVDESPVKVQVENKKGYIWFYYAPYVGNGLVMLEFSTTRSGSVADNRLKNFAGLLQTDGYAGYNKLRKKENIEAFGCLSHARRKFVEVVKITSSNGIASEFVEIVKPLYHLEAKMKRLQVSNKVRKKWRQKEAWPRLKKLKHWLNKQKFVVLPASKLGKAIFYTLSNWHLIVKYARHGIAEIDTNYVENQVRPSAIGKRNWLFVNNARTGNINAFWFSITQSAIMNGLNPRDYFNFLFNHIHHIRKNLPGHEPEKLLPHTINKDILTEVHPIIETTKPYFEERVFFLTDQLERQSIYNSNYNISSTLFQLFF